MDSGLKKRLLGAVVLIALAVIFVPMLLPGHSGADSSQAVSLKIPPQPSGDMQTRILQVGPDSASAGSSTAAAIRNPDHVATLNLEGQAGKAPPPPASATAETLTPPPAASASSQVTTTASAPAASTVAAARASAPPKVAKVAKVAKAPPTSAAPAPPAPPVASAQPIAGGPGAAAHGAYSVNLGIYSDRSSADKLVTLARQHGFTAATSPATFRGKPVARVRVGPFATRAAAEAARLKLQSFEPIASMTIDASATNQVGDAPASALPAGTAGAWAVQLGAFSIQSQADALRNSLRAQGFAGYTDTITTAKGKLWRVRAGPFASRSAAASTRSQIAQKLKIKGDIVTQQ